MSGIKKPKFGGRIFNIIDNVISIITTIFGYTKIPDKLPTLEIAFIIIAIYITTYVGILLLYNVYYSIKLNIFCVKQENYIKKLEKQNIGLKNNNDIIINDYLNLYQDFETSLVLSDSIINHLETGIVNRTESETVFLKQLLSILKIEEETQKKIKGDNKYE